MTDNVVRLSDARKRRDARRRVGMTARLKPYYRAILKLLELSNTEQYCQDPLYHIHTAAYALAIQLDDRIFNKTPYSRKYDAEGNTLTPIDGITPVVSRFITRMAHDDSAAKADDWQPTPKKA